MAWLKRAITKFDILIVIGAVVVITQIDWTDLSLGDYIVLVALGIWFLLLVVRCLIYRKRQAEGLDKIN